MLADHRDGLSSSSFSLILDSSVGLSAFSRGRQLVYFRFEYRLLVPTASKLTTANTYTHIFAQRKGTSWSKLSKLSSWWDRKKHILLILEVVLFLLCIKYNCLNRSAEGGNVTWYCSTFPYNSYRSCVIEKLLLQYEMQVFCIPLLKKMLAWYIESSIRINTVFYSRDSWCF